MKELKAFVKQRLLIADIIEIYVYRLYRYLIKLIYTDLIIADELIP